MLVLSWSGFVYTDFRIRTDVAESAAVGILLFLDIVGLAEWESYALAIPNKYIPMYEYPGENPGKDIRHQ